MLTMIAALAALQDGPQLEARVEATLKRMTLEEKCDLLGGVDDFNVRAIPEANLPRLRMSDGPVGVHDYGLTTAYPAGFTLAATWNPTLAREFGTAIGRDARARGVHIWLGPGVNPARIVQNGRNFEYLGEDPFLIGTMATGIVKGVQSQGVSATVKHYAGNEHENDRNRDDSIIDERTLREIYLKPFEMVVRDAKPGALMTSYNLVNGVHSSENRPIVTDILKREWGFKGVVMSDWVSVYSVKGPYLNGLDLEMPSGKHLNAKELAPLIQSGALPVAPLDDKVRRILRLAYEMEWDKRPQKVDSIPADDPQSRAAAMRAAREGMVLLKNRAGVLPLRGKRILVVGPNAEPAVTGGGGSSYTEPFHSVRVLAAMKSAAPTGTTVEYASGVVDPSRSAAETMWDGGVSAEYFGGTELSGAPILSRTEQKIDNHWRDGQSPAEAVPATHFSVRWKGRYVPTEGGEHMLTVRTDDGMRVFVDGQKVIDQWHDQGETTYSAPLQLTAGKAVDVVVEYYQGGGEGVARVGISGSMQSVMERDLPQAKVAAADAVIACVGFNSNSRYEGEGSDRTWELPAEQVALLKRLVAMNKHVVVVLNAGAGVATAGWLDGAAGFVDAGYPGGEGNLALADLLYGKSNFSGKLPTSFPKEIAGTYYAKAYPPVDHKMVYREGPFMGYRWLDKNGVAPLYPFGFGLSYTSFALTKPMVQNGATIRVSVEVRNTGRKAGAETVQVYAEPPAGKMVRAPRELRAFGKVDLAPGASRKVEMTFARKDLARWDVATHAWKVDPGVYRLRIGTSSRDLPLTVSVKVP